MKQTPLLEELIECFRFLPGIGRKSAQRMAYHLLEKNRAGGEKLSETLAKAMREIQHCQQCRNFSEQPLCTLCSNPKRDSGLVCVVESPADVIAVESSGAFSGVYFVLMGHLSPLDGVGPSQLGLDLFEQQLSESHIREVILATSATVEGEATAHYLSDMVERYQVPISRIAQGVPIGGELEYIDANTLARSINERKKIDY
ncbi:MAG: recombination mediator RecR [Kangiellaceae bacterium]|jgi:recombination protein RecR|nr:recombination mediator RecR [Kangiellaceae bacterium]